MKYTSTILEAPQKNSLQFQFPFPPLSLMASTSAARPTGATTAVRFKSATNHLFSDNQSLIAEIRKAIVSIKEIAVESERQNQTQMVKELEEALVQLLAASEDCAHLSSAIESIGNNYQPKEELTDFKKLITDEIAKVKGSSSTRRDHPLLRQFREAIWKVHHAGQPMPGEEQEDLVMTSTESSILNPICPLTGKHITELSDPVRCMDCKHIYGQEAIMMYLRSKNSENKCPIAGCPKRLAPGRIVRDPLLLIEIDELRTINKESIHPQEVEDITGLDDTE